MFDTVVELYRVVDRPPITGGRFEYSGEINERILDLISSAEALPGQFGSVNVFSKDSSNIEFEFVLPAAGEPAFYRDVEQLIERLPSISKGIVPSQVYLVEDDWKPNDTRQHEGFKKLVDICNLISYLSKLCSSLDVDSSPYYNNLFFAVPALDNLSPKTFVIRTKVEFSLLEHDLRHLALLGALVDNKHEGKIHIEERRMLFQLSIIDILSHENYGSDSLLAVVVSWDSIISSYWRNLQSYVHGFSFDKIRVEVADAEVDYSSKLSSALGDIAGKLLALPVSLAALPVLYSSDDFVKSLSVSVGVVLASLIVLLMVINQWMIVSKLRASFDAVFEKMKESSTAYPRSLNEVLSKTLRNVERQSALLKMTFWFFVLMSLLPLFGVLYIVDQKHDLLNWALDVLKLFEIEETF